MRPSWLVSHSAHARSRDVNWGLRMSWASTTHHKVCPSLHTESMSRTRRHDSSVPWCHYYIILSRRGRGHGLYYFALDVKKMPLRWRHPACTHAWSNLIFVHGALVLCRRLESFSFQFCWSCCIWPCHGRWPSKNQPRLHGLFWSPSGISCLCDWKSTNHFVGWILSCTSLQKPKTHRPDITMQILYTDRSAYVLIYRIQVLWGVTGSFTLNIPWLELIKIDVANDIKVNILRGHFLPQVVVQKLLFCWMESETGWDPRGLAIYG